MIALFYQIFFTWLEVHTYTVVGVLFFIYGMRVLTVDSKLKKCSNTLHLKRKKSEC